MTHPSPPGGTWPGRDGWLADAPPPPGYLPAGADRPTSPPPPAWRYQVLRPPERPHYREVHRVRLPAVAAGAGAAALWYGLFAMLADSAAAYCWLTIVGGVLAGVVIAVLGTRGDRGVAVGIALTSGFTLAVTGLVLVVYWAHGHWLLW